MKQNEITSLPTVSYYRYENFFNVYKDKNGFYFYNLLCNINLFPASNSNVEDNYVVKFNDTWASIAYNYYNTMDLWWLVCAYNKIQNPVIRPSFGTKIKLLKTNYVATVISNLNQQLAE